MKTESRAGLIRRLWAYIKQHHLQAIVRRWPLHGAIALDGMGMRFTRDRVVVGPLEGL